MKIDEYQRLDAVGLAELVASRQVSAQEILDAAISCVSQVNPELNAVTLVLEKEARIAIDAGLPNGSLRGVPFLIKDILAQMKGVPTTAGSNLFKGYPAAADSAIVAAYRRAGLVLFGKTNVPEMGFMPTTEPKSFGRTINPWAPSRIPGGSSGGSAAAVAAGIVPAAHGSDGGGSIRIPAACCGLFGLKPSRGRVSLSPSGGGLGWLPCEHALTRSVRDSAALLDAVCEPVIGDELFLAPPQTPYLKEVGRDPGKLRIGFTTAALTWGELDPPTKSAVRDAAALCESLGHGVEEVEIGVDFLSSLKALDTQVVAKICLALNFEAKRRGCPIDREEVETATWSIYQRGPQTSAEQVAEATQLLNALRYSLSASIAKYDVVLLSTLGKLPLPIGELNSNDADPSYYVHSDFSELSGFAERLYGFMPNTHMFNTSGHPAMSVPLGWTKENVPIGIQFVAQVGREDVLFRLAGQLEASRPWIHKRPRTLM